MPLMRASRLWLFFLIIFLALLGCRAVAVPFTRQATQQALETAVELLPLLRVTDLAQATERYRAPMLTLPPLATRTAAPAALDPVEYTIRVHPDGGLFVGDMVSFEVLAPSGVEFSEARVQVALVGQEPFASADFYQHGIAQRLQATLQWVWDTSGLSPGAYTLVFTVEPGGARWDEAVTLQPVESLPPGAAQIAWAQAQSDCCTVHYLTGTAAARDIDQVLAEIDHQARAVEEKLAASSETPITIILLPRLLGHGGFAGDVIHVSYLDRNYTGGLPEMVLHHELVHILDAHLGEGYQPSLLVEGLAVYLTGGHYKPEPLMARAAALLEVYSEANQPGLGWFLPLAPLTDDFYRAQHEIGYLQAGALVETMVQNWGWEAFADFYGDIEQHSRPSQSLDDALRRHFGISLAELEAQFVDALRRQPYSAALLADVRLTVQHFDTVRRYQQALDPSAHFMTAWLVDTQKMREMGIVADYARRPDQMENIVLELLLANTGEAIVAGQYLQAEQGIAAVNAVLDALDAGWVNPFGASLMAADAAAVIQAVSQNPDWVSAVSSSHISVQRLWLEGDQARVWVASGDAPLQEVRLRRAAGETWQLQDAGLK
jgi:hypothetical protein